MKMMGPNSSEAAPLGMVLYGLTVIWYHREGHRFVGSTPLNRDERATS